MFKSSYSNRIRRISFSAAVALLIAALVFAFAACGQDNEERAAREQYEKGVEAFNNGDFDEAMRCFTLSGMYGDSDQYVKAIEGYEDLYMKGVKAVSERDYPVALSCFGGIRAYLNSRAYIEYIGSLEEKYGAGKILYDQGQFMAARACFVAANGYEQSSAYIENIDAMAELYNKGMRLFNAGNYSDAAAAFRGINTDFEDSAEMIVLAGKRLSSSKISLNAYIKNYNDLYDGSVRIEQGHIEKNFTLKDSRGVLFSGTTDDDGMLVRIAFGFSASVRESLGEAGMTDALKHCINALNPYVSDLDGIESGLYAYLSRSGAGYGSMWIRSVGGAEGALVIEALFYSTSGR